MRAGIAQGVMLVLFALFIIIAGCSRTEVKDFAEDTALEGAGRVIDKHLPDATPEP